jgi:hyperosmotically inducible protein
VLTSKVKNALIVSKVNTSKVTVTSKDGVVTLTGAVPTASQKTQAGIAAKATSGVSSVKNNLAVSAGS